MDVREKLIWLIANAKYIYANDYSDHTEDEYIADTLLDNGVTAQEWVSVTERMPEKNDQWVLCLCVSGAIEVLKFDYTMWNWDAQYPGRCYMENYVTHWMPLPQLPKEVQGNEL